MCTFINTDILHAQDLSQYPHEVEYLWVPCSFVAPAPGSAERMEVTEKHGVVRIVPVHVNSNQTARTLEQMLASKKQTHLAAFRFGLQELQRDLSSTSNELGPARYATDFFKESGGKVYTCEGFVENIMSECKQRLHKHEKLVAGVFAEDETFRSLVTEMLDVKTMAKSKFRLWLDDPRQCISYMEDISINDAHQQLLGFLKKRMQNEDLNARRDTAVKICKLRGILGEIDHEQNDLGQWETRLTSAAAEGIRSNDLKLLLVASGMVSTTERFSEALLKAAQFGHLHCIKILIDANADIHFQSETRDGATPLFVAADNGHADAVDMLLKASADVNAANNKGATALWVTAWNGHEESVIKMLAAHAHVNAASNDGTTPLYMAAQNGHAEAVWILLQAGAHVNAADNEGVTPLYRAAQAGHAGAVKILLDKGADANAADNDDVTPLYRAALYGHEVALSMLLEASADVNAARDDGQGMQRLLGYCCRLVLMSMLHPIQERLLLGRRWCQAAKSACSFSCLALM
jgi:ankyrin repeat protein